MKRLLAILVFLFAMLGTASPAGASDWVCVAIYPINLGVCVGNPFP